MEKMILQFIVGIGLGVPPLLTFGWFVSCVCSAVSNYRSARWGDFGKALFWCLISLAVTIFLMFILCQRLDYINLNW